MKIPFRMIQMLAAFAAAHGVLVASSDFQYWAPIEMPEGEGGFVRVALDPRVWATTRGQFDGLRILDDAGGHVPYAMVERGAGSLPPRSVVVQPEGAKRERENGWIFEIEVPDDIPVLKRICLETRSTGFHYEAHIEALGDRGSKTVESPLYNLRPNVASEQLCIEVDNWETRRLRLRLEGGEETAERRIEVDLSDRQGSIREHVTDAGIRVDGFRLFAETGTSWEALTETIDLGLPAETSARGETAYVWETRWIPLTRIEPSIDESHFSRPFRLRGLDANKEIVWERSGSLVRRMGGGSGSVELTLPGEPVPFVELVIEDGDNPPLAVRGAVGEAVRVELVFPREAAGNPRLAWGNPSLASPAYEISAVLPRLPSELDAFPLAHLGVPRLNADFEMDAGYRIREALTRWGLPVLTVLLVIGLGFWLWKLLRSGSKVGDCVGQRRD